MPGSCPARRRAPTCFPVTVRGRDCSNRFSAMRFSPGASHPRIGLPSPVHLHRRIARSLPAQEQTSADEHQSQHGARQDAGHRSPAGVQHSVDVAVDFAGEQDQGAALIQLGRIGDRQPDARGVQPDILRYDTTDKALFDPDLVAPGGNDRRPLNDDAFRIDPAGGGLPQLDLGRQDSVGTALLNANGHRFDRFDRPAVEVDDLALYRFQPLEAFDIRAFAHRTLVLEDLGRIADRRANPTILNGARRVVNATSPRRAKRSGLRADSGSNERAYFSFLREVRQESDDGSSMALSVGGLPSIRQTPIPSNAPSPRAAPWKGSPQDQLRRGPTASRRGPRCCYARGKGVRPEASPSRHLLVS